MGGGNPVVDNGALALSSRAILLVLAHAWCAVTVAATEAPAPVELVELRPQAEVAGALASPGSVLPRRLRSGIGLPPFILRLAGVNLVVAQGHDRFHSFVSTIEVAIAKCLGLSPLHIQPMALLVYRDRGARAAGSGHVVLLFVVSADCGYDSGVCRKSHDMRLQAWSAALTNSTSPIHQRFRGQVDASFPPKLTPSLCVKWEIRGPGCNNQLVARPHAEDGHGLPFWFVVGVGATGVLLCAMYPVWRVLQIRRSRRYPTISERSATEEAPKIDFGALRRERVGVERLQEDDTCPICLSKPADDPSEDLLMPPCRHCMHVACAEAWLAKQLQCPLCRRAFSADECVVWELVEAGEGAPAPQPVAAPAGMLAAPAGAPEVELEPTAAEPPEPADPGLPEPADESGLPEAAAGPTEALAAADAAAATADAAADGAAAAEGLPVSFTISDPRSPLMRLSLRAVGPGAPGVCMPRAGPGEDLPELPRAEETQEQLTAVAVAA